MHRGKVVAEKENIYHWLNWELGEAA